MLRRYLSISLALMLAGCAPVGCYGPLGGVGVRSPIEYTGPGSWAGPPERVIVRRGGRNQNWHRRAHRREGRRGGRRVVVHKYRFLPEAAGAGLVGMQVANIPEAQWLEELPSDAEVVSTAGEVPTDAQEVRP